MIKVLSDEEIDESKSFIIGEIVSLISMGIVDGQEINSDDDDLDTVSPIVFNSDEL